MHADLNEQTLKINASAEVEKISRSIVAALSQRLRRRGVVLGISGGIDSAVCATLAARAVGPSRVFGLLMPERESPPEALERAVELCRGIGIHYAIEDITGALSHAGCYRRRDDAIRRLFPDYGEGWRQKIVLAGGAAAPGRLAYFDLVVQDPEGLRRRRRMPADIYLQVTSATNMKQRIRKLIEYYHAERLNYAVLGTPNRLEYELGFFVRGGDGLADLKPIAHLYKSQVYDLGRHLGVPRSIREQPPSTDTYSIEQSQEEFYFGLPWHQMDHLLWALSGGLSAEAAGAVTGLAPEHVRKVWRSIEGKRRAARRGLAEAILVEPVPIAEGGGAGT